MPDPREPATVMLAAIDLSSLPESVERDVLRLLAQGHQRSALDLAMLYVWQDADVRR